jgi:hypothetical protein
MIVLTADNHEFTENGALVIGESTMGSRRGVIRTYAARLGAKSASHLDPQPGDSISWHRCDGDLPCCGLKGEFVKADGRRFQLAGTEDVGIDTGHPPCLGLKYVQKWGVEWGYVNYAEIRIVLHCASGRVFADIPGIALGDLSLSRLDRGEVDLDRLPELPLGERWRISWEEDPSSFFEHRYGWRRGCVHRERKVIKKIDTDQPLVL